MFKKKEIKNPISIIRQPAEINKEYSATVTQIGLLELENCAISKAEERQNTRWGEIKKLKEDLVKKVEELSTEMDESQKQIKKLADEAVQPIPEAKL